MADTKSEIERHRASAQREVDDLTRQKESISSHLAQISQLLGTQMPGLSDVLKPPQTRHAVSAPAPKAVTAPAAVREEPRQTATVQAPTGGQPPAAAQKQPVAAKAAKSSDDEWWTE
jgi:hypothetical protein